MSGDNWSRDIIYFRYASWILCQEQMYADEAASNMICIWHPFECDMGSDGTLTSHIEMVCDSFHLNPYRTRMDAIWFSRTKYLRFKFHNKAKLIWMITNTRWESQSAIRHHIRTVLNIDTRPWSARITSYVMCLYVEGMPRARTHSSHACVQIKFIRMWIRTCARLYLFLLFVSSV